jgi:hypothetical protein
MCMRLELKDCLLGEGQTFERECWILLILLKKQTDTKAISNQAPVAPDTKAISNQAPVAHTCNPS